jgi:hypothetical protein
MLKSSKKSTVSKYENNSTFIGYNGYISKVTFEVRDLCAHKAGKK